MRTKTSLIAFALIACSAWSATSGAQTYPARPITLVVPGPPGGATDTLARALAEEMGKRLGQTIIVDNKPGGAGVIAVQAITRGAPDGYTMLLSHSAPLINTPHLYRNVQYDVRRDLSFVTELCVGKIVLAVNRDVPVKSVQELLDWAAKNKGKVSYGSYGVGTFPHLVGSHLNQTRGLDMAHVAYKGEAPMAQDMIAGNVSWAIGSMTTLGPHIKSGRVRPLAVMGEQRIKELPEVPTMAEAGLKEHELRSPAWFGLFVRSGTPAAILSRLETEARASILSPAMRTRLDAPAMEPVGNSPSEFRREFDATEPVIARMIKTSGATAE
ncbi:tripartite tricarboxylate transporter substrate binding protein [Cupriavidus sp. AcVe19-6a]|uniref:Bug family tripartite tricarboxylate transporter substrate binding protein n=1 Tax=Cupriavidus sp. AcVe19-6a TaxID=2821358 RepID=UPI001AE908BC|nr:tripartite tricarboxylate transporter substrate binding protein [Cupriavidus sp. AcVe19-6a]MBP0636988.1 tripartite tricarboxylate transporter substrate binding protein [Cupriavidus sp. AcVe19-6a]